MTPPPFSRAAQAYARQGIAVFPLRPRFKKPLAFTTGLLAASTDPDLAAMRWSGEIDLPMRAPKGPDERLPDRVRAKPTCNVACATGEISGVWVLDIDGPAGEASLTALVAVHGDLPPTPEQRTGGGRQILFAWDPALEIRNTAGKIGDGIDVRGNGGYVVLPPSVHPGDTAKGVPPGRIYSWIEGRAAGEIPYAPAPAWLLQLVCPPAPAATSPPRPARPIAADGGTTKFGAVTLSTSCREVALAPPGKQQSSLFGYAAFIGAYVAGGEIEEGQAREALIDAGLRMTATKGAWTRKEVESAVVRGMEKGMAHPKSAPERRAFQPAGRSGSGPAAQADRPNYAPTPAQVAEEVRGVRGLWDSARSADCAAVRSWFKLHGLDPAALPGGLGGLRAHARAPIGEGPYGEILGAAILIPLLREIGGADWSQEIEALALIPLAASRVTGFIGDIAGRVACLSPLPSTEALLVGIDFADVWTLGQNAWGSGHELGVILAPTLDTFAGGALGDTWGRLDPRAPMADPDAAPWTLDGLREVHLAVREDLRSPEFKVRKVFGGTDRVTLQGAAAARFYGGLAQQAWARAGANPVRIMRPSTGVGFSQGRADHGR